MSKLSFQLLPTLAEFIGASPWIAWAVNACRRHPAFVVLTTVQALLLNIAYIGPGFNDDPVYIDNAIRMLAEHSPALSPEGCRLLVVGPLAALFGVLGIGDLAIRIISTFWGCAGLLAVYGLGLRLQGKVLAVVASLFWIVFPVVFQHSTQIVTDIPAGIASALAVYCFLRGGLFSYEDGETEIRWHFAGGVLTGLAYLGKTPAVLVLVLPFLCALRQMLKGHISRKGLAALGGALVIWGGEGVMYLLVARDFLFHYHAEAAYYLNPDFIRYNRNSDLLLYPRLMFAFDSSRGTYPFGLLFYLCIPGAVVGLFRRPSKAVLAVLIWLVVSLAYYEFGSMSLTHYELVDRTARYFCTLAVPIVLVAGVAITFLLTHRRMLLRTVGCVLFGVAFFVAMRQSVHAYRHDQGGVMDVRGVWDFLRTADPKVPVYCDPGLVSRMKFLEGAMQSERTYLWMESSTTSAQLAGKFVVFNSLNFLGEVDLRPQFQDCLEGLSPIATISIPGQVGAFSTYDPVIYFVPAKRVALSPTTGADSR